MSQDSNSNTKKSLRANSNQDFLGGGDFKKGTISSTDEKRFSIILKGSPEARVNLLSEKGEILSLKHDRLDKRWENIVDNFNPLFSVRFTAADGRQGGLLVRADELSYKKGKLIVKGNKARLSANDDGFGHDEVVGDELIKQSADFSETFDGAKMKLAHGRFGLSTYKLSDAKQNFEGLYDSKTDSLDFSSAIAGNIPFGLERYSLGSPVKTISLGPFSLSNEFPILSSGSSLFSKLRVDPTLSVGFKGPQDLISIANLDSWGFDGSLKATMSGTVGLKTGITPGSFNLASGNFPISVYSGVGPLDFIPFIADEIETGLSLDYGASVNLFGLSEEYSFGLTFDPGLSFSATARGLDVTPSGGINSSFTPASADKITGLTMKGNMTPNAKFDYKMKAGIGDKSKLMNVFSFNASIGNPLELEIGAIEDKPYASISSRATAAVSVIFFEGTAWQNVVSQNDWSIYDIKSGNLIG